MSLAAPHAGYVIAAYLLTAVVLAGLIATIVITLKSRQRHLQQLESRTARRETGERPPKETDNA